METSYEQLDAEIGSVLDYNPPELLAKHDSPCPKLVPPLSFYDKHLDEQLSLKKVCVIPSFTTHLSGAVDRVFRTIRDDDLALPSVDCGFPTLESVETSRDNRPVVDAEAVGKAYQVVTSAFASDLASMLSLHLRAPEWSSSFSLRTRATTRHQDYYALNEDFSLELLKPYSEPESYEMIPKETWNSMDVSMQEDLKQVMQRFPLLAVWQMFFVCREAEDALKHMGKLVSMDAFPHLTFLTHAPWCRPTNVDRPQPPDAISTAWGVPVSSFIGSATVPPTETASLDVSSTALAAVSDPSIALRRSARISLKANVGREASRKKLKQFGPKLPIKPPSRSIASNRRWSEVSITVKPRISGTDEHMAISILQHAWTRAVERDSSFIVLHSGNLERIAFRHRSSRTLYLSDLIDVTRCKDPAYGEIHTGLFMAIIEDALDRTRQLVRRENKPEAISPGKRKREASRPFEKSKRPRTRAGAALEASQRVEYCRNFEAICQEATDRPLALLSVRHHHFNTAVPASFLRVNRAGTAKKSVYKPHEYFCLTITSEIGSGATGDVHAATMELLGADGEDYSVDKVVVKLAFEPDQRRRIKHEYELYDYLKSSGVTGIPHIFGLFEDVESDTLALVMNNVGTCLWDRRPDKKRAAFPVSQSERAAFADVLKTIHDAGVRHRDIRAENLVVSDEGVVSIIDFDRADMKASERSRQRELEHLLALLGGDYSTVGGLPSYGTPDRRYSFESEAEEPDVREHDVDKSVGLAPSSQF